ncbi:hypothetical protein MNBD_GAMMA18-679 [hydrothermal vent metagenome]|uniref:NHL repeat domain protein n=1 Tax=hydrothermal vent metagenome TaxID=652676 RepID=A0A3B0Z7N0_9ZZZZ
MQYLPHKIITITTPLLLLFIAITLSGCSGNKRADFKPPQYPDQDPRFIYERTIHDSSDIRDLTAAMKFQFLATGSTETSTGLAKPFGIAVRKGKVYVSDTVQRAVVLFDIPRGEAKFIGIDEGPGMLMKPLGIDVDSEGNLYVADITDKSIKIYTGDGEFIRKLEGRAIFDRPSGVAISPDGNTLYVVDSGGISSTRHHLHVIDVETFEIKRTVGKRGTEPGDFNLPIQVSTAPDGTVYVVDGGNFRVQSFTAEGDFISTFGVAGRYSGNFSRPKGISTDSDNNVYVGDSAFGNFQIFNPKGELLLFVGKRGNRGAPGEFMLTSGLEVDEDGRIYYADQFFRKIDIFRPTSITAEDGFLGTKYRDEVRKAMKDE